MTTDRRPRYGVCEYIDLSYILSTWIKQLSNEILSKLGVTKLATEVIEKILCIVYQEVMACKVIDGVLQLHLCDPCAAPNFLSCDLPPRLRPSTLPSVASEVPAGRVPPITAICGGSTRFAAP